VSSDDRCFNCGAPLASDQRYCVACGERRGRARFTIDEFAALTAPKALAAPQPEASPMRWPRTSAATTLLTGIATLLIAMGVGVLIGHNNATGFSRASAPVQVVTVGGGAAGVAAAPVNSGLPPKHGKVAKVKPKVIHITAKVAKAADQAAAHVFGSNSNLSKNVTQKQGGACSGGAGCEHGKFTGNFFGSG
jgi:hypothetical protein